MKDNQFIVMWDCNGLESIVPIDMDKLGKSGDFLAKLEGGKNAYVGEISRMLWAMKLRANANTQRHYEIYSLRTSPNITQQELEKLFEDNPQSIVDLIRQKGVEIYSNRALGKPKII